METTNIERRRRDTYPETAVILNDGSPMDLTSCTVIMTIKYDTPIVITAIIDDAPTGAVSFHFTEDDVFTAGTYEYDIQVTYPDNSVGTHAYGDLILLRDVSA